MKRCLAEMIGTLVLVVMGCGAAVFNGGCGTVPQVLTVAFAFGLSVVGMAYAIGGVSGCHINPAVTLGVWLSKRMEGKEAAMYILFQVIGALIGSTILYFLTTYISADYVTSTGANMLGSGVSVAGGFIAEMIFTAVFVLVVLGSTSKNNGAGNNAGLAIGLTLVLVHIVCIPITGTSVNPARSIGPAIYEGLEALSQLWIFILAPLCGAVIAAGIWKVIGHRE